MRGTANLGFVTEVVHKFDDVKWNKNKPHFVVVQFDGQDAEFLAHPSQLKHKGS